MNLRFRFRYGFRMRDFVTVGRSARSPLCWCLLIGVALGVCGFCGCKDGPLYAMKTVNPYFAMREWRADEAFGVTDHERRKQLHLLSQQIGGMSPDQQDFWAGHLKQIMENDPSPEMRRLAVVAAGKLRDESALSIVEKGLDDESLKVRLYACKALGGRREEQSARLLAKTAGSESDEDVRRAALAALANHKSPLAVDALRLALADRNPATRDLVMQSLRNVTGKNYGNDPQQWIAALDQRSGPGEQLAERERDAMR